MKTKETMIQKYDKETDAFDVIDSLTGEVVRSSWVPFCLNHRKLVKTVDSATGFYCPVCKSRVIPES